MDDFIIPANPGFKILIRIGGQNFLSTPIIAWRISGNEAPYPITMDGECSNNFAYGGAHAIQTPDGSIRVQKEAAAWDDEASWCESIEIFERTGTKT